MRKRNDNGPQGEWSSYYRLFDNRLEAMHAAFITHRYPRHAHEYLVVGLVRHGIQSYTYRGVREYTPDGNVFIVNPEEPHTGESADGRRYLLQTLYPRADLLNELCADLRCDGPFFESAVLADHFLASLLIRCHWAIANGASKVEGEARVLDALAYLLAAYSRPRPDCALAPREPHAIRQAREYIEAHFADDLALSDVARAVFLSPYYFARAFERQTGLPPHAYLENVRMRKARRFLDDGAPIAEAAVASGYADQSHFTRRFKKLLGITPRQYVPRRSNR